MRREFQEVAHAGGQVSLKVKRTSEGQLAYQVSYSGSRPVPVALIALWALPQGIPVCTAGLVPTIGPAPFSGCLLVVLGSDSDGLFGHLCPECEGYWRSGPWPLFCPYCGVKADALAFLSEAQGRYIEHYCRSLTQALGKVEDNEFVIDMDAVADAVSDPASRPEFYVSEESQQHKFSCMACDAFNDILGDYGYCSECGTRNDLALFEQATLPKIRDRLEGGNPPEDCIRDAVAALDSFIGQYARQLARRVPLTNARRTRLLKERFHELNRVVKVFRDWFGIDVTTGLKSDDAAFAALMFHRRHVYEHKGGEADEKYIRDSGDAVRPKQRLRNSMDDGRRLIRILLRLARNLHAGFHELLPPDKRVLSAHGERRERTTAQQL